MFKVWKLQLQREIEELKSLHRIELKEKEAELMLQIRDREEQLKRREADLVKDAEIKTREVVSLLKLESEQKLRQLEIDFQRKLDAADRKAEQQVVAMKSNLLQEHYDKLATAMSKLHEEGNITTKFTQELALKMMGNAPAHKTETRVLTGKTGD